MKIVLASNNQKKLHELKAILGRGDLEVLLQNQVGEPLEVEETGATFEENAILKAEAVCQHTGIISISDDSGLWVEALEGAPGVYSARYGGEACQNDTDRWKLLLQNMEGITDRRCKFVCVICCAFPGGDKILVRGECPGVVAAQPAGEGGFGYDPVFYLPDRGLTMAQLAPEEKNQISHRARALVAFLKEWENYHRGTNQ